MTWRDIIKVDVIADSQKAIDVVGEQKDILNMIDKVLRKFANGEELDEVELVELEMEHKYNSQGIEQILTSLLKKIEGA
tara:strand:+ start:161 stop:397 length:237 start_codon:yes stop_codon:yes gene_type:complete